MFEQMNDELHSHSLQKELFLFTTSNTFKFRQLRDFIFKKIQPELHLRNFFFFAKTFLASMLNLFIDYKHSYFCGKFVFLGLFLY